MDNDDNLTPEESRQLSILNYLIEAPRLTKTLIDSAYPVQVKARRATLRRLEKSRRVYRASKNARLGITWGISSLGVERYYELAGFIGKD